MIEVFIYSDGDGYSGFETGGHAGFSEAPYDIICSAVSILMINTVNSIEKLSDTKVISEAGDGHLICRFPEGTSEKSNLLMRSMIMGLEGIQKQYGSRYLQVRVIRRN